MIAILILAGRSTRFWPLSEKSFFPVGGTTLLEEQVKRLRAAGLEKIIFVAGAHNIDETRTRFSGQTVIEQENLDLGMRGALLSTLPSCGKEPVLIVSANDLVDSHAYETLCDHGRTKGVTGYLLSRKVTSYFPGGYLVLDGRRVTDIVEKPGAGKEPSSLINIVAHIHNDPTTLLDALKNARSSRDDGYEVALKGLLSGHRYESVPYDGLWSTVKYPWHLLGLLDALLPKTGGPVIDPSASIHPTAVIEGPVILSAGVRIFPHATVRGPCFIGKNTIIANSALVRGSSIGSNCVIGYNTEVARSVLANDVWTHSSYIGDSAIGSNVSFGAGTTTGNLRLDEAEIHSMVKGENIPSGLTKFGAIIGDGCRTGIHTCTSPGIKIGQGTFVNSMTLVTEDVPDRSYAKMDNGKLTLRPNRISASTKDRDAFRGKL